MSAWVSAFGVLSERHAALQRVYGEFYKHPLSDEQWRAEWVNAVVGSTLPLDYGWPSALWLEFDDYPVLRLTGCSHGEGFDLDLEEEAPREEAEVAPGAWFFVKELAGLPPFGAVRGAPLRAINVLTWLTVREGEDWEKTRAARPAGSRTWDDRLPGDAPVGVRLGFDEGTVWIMNIADEIEIYDRRPPLWDEEARRYDLREWEWRTRR